MRYTDVKRVHAMRAIPTIRPSVRPSFTLRALSQNSKCFMELFFTQSWFSRTKYLANTPTED